MFHFQVPSVQATEVMRIVSASFENNLGIELNFIRVDFDLISFSF